MKIRELTVEDIKYLYPLAESFFASSAFLVDFDNEHFSKQWKDFINIGCGVIFGLFESEKIIGALGGIKFIDPNNGKLMASELFWFVLPAYRGEGKRLLNAFEMWAKTQKCKSLTMVYLTDSMPDIVGKIYEHRGYRAMEVHYVKEVQ